MRRDAYAEICGQGDESASSGDGVDEARQKDQGKKDDIVESAEDWHLRAPRGIRV